MKLANLFLTDATLISFVKENFVILFAIGVITVMIAIGTLCAFIFYVVKTNARLNNQEVSTKALNTDNEQLKEAQEKASHKLEEYKKQAEETMAEANAKRDALVQEAKAKADASKSSLLDSQTALREKVDSIIL